MFQGDSIFNFFTFVPDVKQFRLLENTWSFKKFIVITVIRTSRCFNQILGHFRRIVKKQQQDWHIHTGVCLRMLSWVPTLTDHKSKEAWVKSNVLAFGLYVLILTDTVGVLWCSRRAPGYFTLIGDEATPTASTRSQRYYPRPWNDEHSLCLNSNPFFFVWLPIQNSTFHFNLHFFEWCA